MVLFVLISDVVKSLFEADISKLRFELDPFVVVVMFVVAGVEL